MEGQKFNTKTSAGSLLGTQVRFLWVKSNHQEQCWECDKNAYGKCDSIDCMFSFARGVRRSHLRPGRRYGCIAACVLHAHVDVWNHSQSTVALHAVDSHSSELDLNCC